MSSSSSSSAEQHICTPSVSGSSSSSNMSLQTSQESVPPGGPSSSATRAEIRLPADIDWKMLDKSRFFFLGAAMFSGVSATLYPVVVLKTRQQVCGGCGGTSSVRLALDMVRHEGIGAFYRGFGTSLLGTLPARALYMSTLEITKSCVNLAANRFGISEPAASAAANAAAGLSASMAAQLVWTPIDVISQRLMVQSKESNPGSISTTSYRGGVHAFQTILKMEGWKGLYRGFGMSIITYAPSSALWWASYCVTQRTIWRQLGYCSGFDCIMPSGALIMGVQGVSAACAGGVAAVVTTPLDTIKTRLQVLENEEHKRPTVKETVRNLLKEGGWRACYKGIGPRWASMSMSATTMITTYELLKRLSAKEEYEVG